MAKIRVGEKEIEGEFVPFTPSHEGWSEYTVGNYVVRVKEVISEVFQAKDEKDAVGNPLFYVQTNPVIIVKKSEVKQ